MSKAIVTFFVFAAVAGLLLAIIRNTFRCGACGGWKSTTRLVEEEVTSEDAEGILQSGNSSRITHERVCTSCRSVLPSRTPRA